MSMTFAQIHCAEPIDWSDILNKAHLLNEENLDYYRSKAGNWVTCACGNLCQRLPRTAGQPDDEQLRKLGNQFAEVWDLMYEARQAEDAKQFSEAQSEAKRILKKIEDRSAKLLAEMS